MACHTKTDTPPAPAVNRDSVVVYGWYDSVMYYLGRDNDAALRFINIGMSYADSAEYERGVALGYYFKGVHKAYTSKYDSAIIFYNISTDRFKQLKLANSLGHCMLQLGIAYSVISEMGTAKLYLDSSFNYYKQANDSMGLANVLAKQGELFQSSGDFKTALKYYLEASRFAEKTKDSFTKFNIYSCIARIHQKTQNFDKALDYINKSLQFVTNEPEWQATMLSERGIVYSNLRNFDLGIRDLDSAKLIYKKIGSTEGIASIYLNIGLIKYYQEDYLNAIAFTDSAFKEYLNLKLQAQIGITLYNLAGMRMAIKDYSAAEKHYMQSLKYINETNNTRILRNIYKELSQMYDSLSNFKLAYQYHKQYKLLDDSIYNANKAREMTEMELNYQFSEKEKIKLLETQQSELLLKAQINQQRTQKVLILFSTLIFILLGSFGFLWYRNRQRTRLQKTERELLVNTQQTIARQMNPHFIFNCLNSVRSLVMDNKPEEADQHIMQFARLMRLTLQQTLNDLVTLSDELEALKLYLSLEQLRFKGRFDYQVVVSEDLDTQITGIPPLLLQPFAENAIIHGFSRKENHGLLRIEISKVDDTILCIIDDNGVGRETTLPKPGHISYGTNLTKQRIELIEKIYGNSLSIRTIDKKSPNNIPEGTRVELILPVILK